MFGNFRRKVTDQTIAMVRQPYAAFQSAYGVPPGFWQDEFVLGFFGVMIGLISGAIGQGRLSQADKGHLVADTFGALSNMNGAAITRRFNELVLQQPQQPDFKRGGDYGEIVTLAMFGKGSEMGRPAIEAAKDMAAAQGRAGDPGAVAAVLAQTHFVQPLIDRFSL